MAYSLLATDLDGTLLNCAARLPKRRFQPRFGETRSFYCIQESVGNAFLLVRDVLK